MCITSGRSHTGLLDDGKVQIRQSQVSIEIPVRHTFCPHHGGPGVETLRQYPHSNNYRKSQEEPSYLEHLAESAFISRPYFKIMRGNAKLAVIV